MSKLPPIQSFRDVMGIIRDMKDLERVREFLLDRLSNRDDFWPSLLVRPRLRRALEYIFWRAIPDLEARRALADNVQARAATMGVLKELARGLLCSVETFSRDTQRERICELTSKIGDLAAGLKDLHEGVPTQAFNALVSTAEFFGGIFTSVRVPIGEPERPPNSNRRRQRGNRRPRENGKAPWYVNDSHNNGPLRAPDPTGAKGGERADSNGTARGVPNSRRTDQTY